MVFAASWSIPGSTCEYCVRVNATEAWPSRSLTIFGCTPGRQRCGGVAVRDVMQPDGRQAEPGHEPVEALPNHVGVDRTPVLPGEDQIVDLVTGAERGSLRLLALAVSPQRFDRHRVQRKPSLPALGAAGGPPEQAPSDRAPMSALRGGCGPAEEVARRVGRRVVARD